ncbi:hypothetical protein DFJ73DRAFT_914581 [Zopfochytrium polystomum]|nr:hypothetical protein DFJ73DRAFT_914581 [Zopfochytrium polystomum]
MAVSDCSIVKSIFPSISFGSDCCAYTNNRDSYIDCKDGRIIHLSVPGKSLAGAVPSEVFKLTALETLNLNNNKFKGGFPSGVAGLSNLKYLRSRIASIRLPIHYYLDGRFDCSGSNFDRFDTHNNPAISTPALAAIILSVVLIAALTALAVNLLRRRRQANLEAKGAGTGNDDSSEPLITLESIARTQTPSDAVHYCQEVACGEKGADASDHEAELPRTKASTAPGPPSRAVVGREDGSYLPAYTEACNSDGGSQAPELQRELCGGGERDPNVN